MSSRCGRSVKGEREPSAPKFDLSLPLVSWKLLSCLSSHSHYMTSEIQFLCTSCFLFVAILCPALNLVTTAVQRAKFSLANTVLITSPTQTFLLLHSQLTSKQQNEPKLCSVTCDQPDFKGSCSFPLCLYIPPLIFHPSGKRLFPCSYTLPIYRPLYWIHNLALKKEFIFVLTLLSSTCFP